jgi:hypothetical protein
MYSASVWNSYEFYKIFDGVEIPQNALNPIVVRTLGELDAHSQQNQTREVEITFNMTGSCDFHLSQDVVVPVFEQGHAWQTYAVPPRRWGEDLPSLAYMAQRAMEGRAPRGVT